MPKPLHTLIDNFRAFGTEARELLSESETSRYRVISLEKIQNRLASLSLAQESLFSESIKCITYGLYRPAIVVAWAAFMDSLEDSIIKFKLNDLHTEYPKWGKILSAQDLRENENDSNIIDAAAKVRILLKSERKVLQGHLAKRNECAHPGSHTPSLNEALGYVDELLRRTGAINSRLSL